MNNFNEIIECAIQNGPKVVAVACCQDKEVLVSIDIARKKGMIKAILVGDIPKTKELCNELGIQIENYEVIHIEDLSQACLKAVELVSTSKADLLMKGIVDTSVILKAALDKEVGLRTGNVLSHVAVFEIDKYHKPLLITDAAMNLSPDLNTKAQIIENSCQVAYALNIASPKVAVICAKEKVNPKMEATVHAKELEQMSIEGKIGNCIVGGPFGLDNAISKDAANHKGIDHQVAGDADILLVPNLESGNVLYKSLVFFANTKNAGLIVGATNPIILTSRADSEETKLNSIALGVLMVSKQA